MQVASRSYLTYRLALAVVIGGGAGFIGAVSVPGGWIVGLALFLAILVISLRMPLRRLRAVRRELPAGVRRWLEEDFPWLPTLDRERFDRDVKIVLREWTFEGVDGVEVDDWMRAGVAAGAALLLHGRPLWELPPRQTVLFYPDRFDADYLIEDDATFDGMAHHQGPIILSARAVEESWDDPADGSNVVLHELAHLLDFENAFADGVPSLLDPGSEVAWRELVRRETRRVRLGRSMLRRYAAKDPAEFFAVSVENFFERPDMMEERHPELFGALKALFRMDPRRAVGVEGRG